MEPIRSLVSRGKRAVGDLRGFSSIKFGEYWNTTTCSPQKANILTTLTRTFWYTSENREVTIQHISTLIEQAFSVLQDMYNHLEHETNLEYQLILKGIIQEIQVNILKCQDGILNLKGVYYKDEETKTEIDGLIADIKRRFDKSLDACPIDTGVQYADPHPPPAQKLISAKPRTAPIHVKPISKSNTSSPPGLGKTPPSNRELPQAILPPPPAPPEQDTDTDSEDPPTPEPGLID